MLNVVLADRMAVAAGVTVVASTGDAGVTGTTGSPATNRDVIGVAATTTYRLYQQTGFGGANFSNGQWINNNISGLSSGGISQGARVPDLAAPGDEGWALCTPNPAVYLDCADDAGNPSRIIPFGGTSQSSPLTAGAAALVVQAYRRTHGGTNPTPALVKLLLTSTATDLGHPAYEQGAGLLNALAAVRAAQSYPTSAGRPSVRGANLVLDRSQVSKVGNPGAAVGIRTSVRNLSTRATTITASLRSLGAEKAFLTGKAPINTDTAPTFTDPFGIKRAYVERSFRVSASGHDRLVVRAAASSAPNGALRTILIDPKGRLAYYTFPQGSSNYALAEVRQPLAGTWKAYFAFGQAAGYHGYVRYSAAVQDFVTRSAGAAQRVAAGAVGTFRVSTTLPRSPGDASDSVQFRTSTGLVTSMPLTLRAVVPARPTTFTGTITGGNGRQFLPAQANSYYIQVPKGKPALDVDLRFGDDNTLVTAVLVGPNGQVYSYKTNGGTFDTAGFNLFARNPKAGRWVLSLAVANPVSGTRISYKFSARVDYTTVKVSAARLPTSTSTVLPAGRAVTVPVRISNSSARNSLDLFADARLNRTGSIPLAQRTAGATTFALPAAPGVTPSFLVPTEVTRAAFSISATTPVNWDVAFASLAPEIYTGSTTTGATSVATAVARASQVSPGFWFGDVGEPGPFATTAPAGTAHVSAVATGKLFDRRVVSSTGDFWTDGPTTFDNNGAITGGVRPLSLLPGETGTLRLKITPTGAPGTRVHGTIYLGSYDGTFGGAGDEIIALPYSYTVGA